MWKWMSLFQRKNHLLRCWGSLSLLNWIGPLHYLYCLNCLQENWSFNPFYEVSCSWGCSVSLKSIIHPCMEYCCHVWAGTPSCYLELLDKLQKLISRTVAPSLAVSHEPLAHHRNVVSLSLFYRYYFGRCSLELAQLTPLPFSRGGLLITLIYCMIFLSPFLNVTRMSMSTVSFLAQLNSGIFCL